MANIIAGEFATIAETETVADTSTSADFDATDSAVFMLTAPGQHVIYPIGGDEDAAPGARQAHTGAVSGAIIGATVGLGLGAATMAATEVGPAIAATVAAAGAYAGSLVGALNKVGDDETFHPHEPVRHAGAMVAVNAISAMSVKRAIAVLRAHGAKQVESAEGRLDNGKWIDFDPLAAPHIVNSDAPAHARQSGDGAVR